MPLKINNIKTFIIHRNLPPKGTKDPFLCVYQDHLIQAMNNLTHTAFKTYLCLLFNKDRYAFSFSPEYISKIAGLHQDTATKNRRELEEKGYLVLRSGDLYDFYETPYNGKVEPPIYGVNDNHSTTPPAAAAAGIQTAQRTNVIADAPMKKNVIVVPIKENNKKPKNSINLAEWLED